MTTQHDVFKNLVDSAMERVIEQGTENASQKDINIALLGWIHTSIHSSQNNNRTRSNGLRGKVQQYSTPTIAGGGFVGLLLLILERLG